MEPKGKNQEWIITEVDGKIASISLNYKHFAEIAAKIADLQPRAVSSVKTYKIPIEQLPEVAKTTSWDDLMLFGSKFQKEVWHNLFLLNHRDGAYSPAEKLYSYTEFARICGSPHGIRAVAHAVAANPVAFLIPCHLIIPKESIDNIMEIRARAQSTLFKGKDLYLLDTVNVGKFAYGPEMKRRLIIMEFGI